MAPLTTYGGNLIATLDFFRVGAKYHKVTEKVDVAGLQPRDVAALDFSPQLVLLKTVAHSLKILHDLHIVHSDLKPSNVMIKRTELGYHDQAHRLRQRSLRVSQPRQSGVRSLRCGDDTPIGGGHRRTRPGAARHAPRSPAAAPPPVRRAINREPVVEEEWPHDDEMSYRMIPMPGGCIMVGTPRSPR